MKTTVQLQDPFSYALWPVVVVAILVVSMMIGFCVLWIRRYNAKKKKEIIMKPRVTMENIGNVKAKYIAELEQMKAEILQGKCSTRAGFQRMSVCIREFVYEVTGIQVQNYTLYEIKGLNIPVLEELITEYYAPEFAMRSIGDSMASIEKTKRAIERWNLEINT